MPSFMLQEPEEAEGLFGESTGSSTGAAPPLSRTPLVLALTHPLIHPLTHPLTHPRTHLQHSSNPSSTPHRLILLSYPLTPPSHPCHSSPFTPLTPSHSPLPFLTPSPPSNPSHPLFPPPSPPCPPPGVIELTGTLKRKGCRGAQGEMGSDAAEVVCVCYRIKPLPEGAENKELDHLHSTQQRVEGNGATATATSSSSSSSLGVVNTSTSSSARDDDSQVRSSAPLSPIPRSPITPFAKDSSMRLGNPPPPTLSQHLPEAVAPSLRPSLREDTSTGRS